MANYRETGGYCRHCDERVMVRCKTASHVLHLLLSLVTLGFWIPIWFLCSISVAGWRCPKCGSKASTRVPRRTRRKAAA